MRKTLATAIATLSLFAATGAFAHAGEVHTYMGTVTMVHDDGSFMMQKKDEGQTLHVAVSPATVWTRADGAAAAAKDLATGMRVVVKIAKDGKTATLVKMSGGTK